MAFKQHYRQLFETFGYPLTERCAMPPAVLEAAAKNLDVTIPAALRDYYLVAGYQAVCGGMACCASQIVPDFSQIHLDNTWTYFGECSDVRAYSRSGQAVCLTLFWPPWENHVSIHILAGGKTKRDLNTIENDLGVDLD